MRLKRKLFIAGFVSVVGLYMLSFSGIRPDTLGATNGKLSPLPESPNAVSTQTTDRDRIMAPVPFSGSPSQAVARIEKVINELPRTEIVTKTNDYIHAEFRSLIFRFVDDVEFWVDAENKQIHFRSASRVGHSDMGANRNRMQKIVALLSK